MLCWGGRSFEFGQVGILSGAYSAVATCSGNASCIPVSSVPYVSFSDNSYPVTQMSLGYSTTCGI
jgi:hypothetical protein